MIWDRFVHFAFPQKCENRIFTWIMCDAHLQIEKKLTDPEVHTTRTGVRNAGTEIFE